MAGETVEGWHYMDPFQKEVRISALSWLQKPRKAALLECLSVPSAGYKARARGAAVFAEAKVWSSIPSAVSLWWTDDCGVCARLWTSFFMGSHQQPHGVQHEGTQK